MTRILTMIEFFLDKRKNFLIFLEDYIIMLFFPVVIFAYNIFTFHYLRILFALVFSRKANFNTESNKYNQQQLNRYFKKYTPIRKLKNLCFFWIITTGFLVAVAFTTAILGYFIIQGIAHFRITEIWSPFRSTELTSKGYTGLAGPLVSTMLMLFIALIVSLPIALLTVIYIREYCRFKWIRSLVLQFSQVCNAIPSIVFGIIGVLIFVSLIRFNRLGFSILSAGFTITLVLLPTMIVSFYDSFDRVPSHIRDGSLSLGATRFQMIRTLIIPIAVSGLVKCLIISLTRGAGEAAPILFTIGGSNAIPHSAFDSGNTLALLLFQQFLNPTNFGFFYAIAFLILLFILFLNILLRVIFYPIGLRQEVSLAEKIQRLKPEYIKKQLNFRLNQSLFNLKFFFVNVFDFYRIWKR